MGGEKMNNDEQGFLMFVKLILISWVFIWAGAIAGEPIDYPKIKKLKGLNGQYCFTKVIITTKDDTVTKEEKLICADGRKNFDTPGYWDLYAEFYYRDTNTPKYCRYYDRPNHAFNTPGKACLNLNGDWEVQ
jgi:hypothetical protein